MISRVARQLLECRNIFRKAAATEADARFEKRRSDALVQTHSPGDRDDVCADLFADVRNLVDEADLGRQERVGRVLDHLGRGHARADDRGAERLIQGGDAVTVFGAELADDDAVRLEEVRDGRALFEELGVGAVPHHVQTAGIELCPNALAGADRHRALHDQQVTRVGPDRGELLDETHDA